MFILLSCARKRQIKKESHTKLEHLLWCGVLAPFSRNMICTKMLTLFHKGLNHRTCKQFDVTRLNYLIQVFKDELICKPWQMKHTR